MTNKKEVFSCISIYFTTHRIKKIQWIGIFYLVTALLSHFLIPKQTSKVSLCHWPFVDPKQPNTWAEDCRGNNCGSWVFIWHTLSTSWRKTSGWHLWLRQINKLKSLSQNWSRLRIIFKIKCPGYNNLMMSIKICCKRIKSLKHAA